MDINQIFENNEKWISQKLGSDDHYFETLAAGQEPNILYIGCSDSRVAPELFMGAGPGDLFVHRNIANVVANDDVNGLSVINYAVAHLSVDHLVICGHYGCGGVKAAMQTDELGILNPWLKHIRDVYRLHKNELDAINKKEQRYRRLVELNAREQAVNALKIPEVQRAFNNDELAIHGWVFDLYSGGLVDLEIDFDAILDGLESVYTIL